MTTDRAHTPTLLAASQGERLSVGRRRILWTTDLLCCKGVFAACLTAATLLATMTEAAFGQAASVS